MTRIVVDASVRDQLAEVSEAVELCDASGKVLGRFTPSYRGSEDDLESPHPTSEELRRTEQSDPRRYTTDEVLQHLHRLGKS